MNFAPIVAAEEIQRFGIAGVIVGIVLLLFGRKMFWFLIAALGFYAGIVLSREMLHLGNDWHAILIGALCGIAGVFLVTAVQKIAVGLFGFFAGAFLVTTFALSYHMELHWWWIVIGGILGAVIVGKLFQIALILLSSLLGSYAVLREISTTPDPFQSPLFYVLALIGLAVQFSMYKSGKEKRGNDGRRRTEPPPPEKTAGSG